MRRIEKGSFSFWREVVVVYDFGFILSFFIF